MMNDAKRSARFFALFAAVACLLAMPVFAEEPDEDEGIPAYAIARLKVLAGTAWVKPDGGGDWEEATTNTPLTPNSRVSVPEGSEAELQFHGGQFVLLTAGTDLEARDMAEDKTQFRLRAGEIRFDLPESDFAPVTVRIPGGSRTYFPEPGRYWLTVTDDDTTRLVVRQGRASVTQEGAVHRVSAGQQAEIGRDIAIRSHEYAAEPAPPPEEAMSEAGSGANVPPVVHGELSEYGEWVQSPTYGSVWRPRVSVGWTPYVYGRWAWVAPYGWMWVSYEPWGWYPYHSGYWVSDLSYGWVWTPYNSFVSVGIVFGTGHHHHYHRNFHYRRSNARFIPEGRDVRWVPLRPGERTRSYRTEFPRGDSRLRAWNRPLENNRVFVRPRTAVGAPQREWRDVTVVRSERQAAIRTAPVGGPRKDARSVRPELQQRVPRGDRPAVQQRPVEQKRVRSAPAPASVPRESAPARRVAPPRESAPAQRVAPSRESAPAQRVAPPRESAPAQRVVPFRESAPAPRVAPPRESAPVQRVAPSREFEGGGVRGGGEGTRGNGGSRGGGDRGGWGDRGGGDRGGGGVR